MALQVELLEIYLFLSFLNYLLALESIIGLNLEKSILPLVENPSYNEYIVH